LNNLDFKEESNEKKVNLIHTPVVAFTSFRLEKKHLIYTTTQNCFNRTRRNCNAFWEGRNWKKDQNLILKRSWLKRNVSYVILLTFIEYGSVEKAWGFIELFLDCSASTLGKKKYFLLFLFFWGDVDLICSHLLGLKWRENCD
jgi:hypothetical protein